MVNEVDDLIKENLKKKLEFEGKLLDLFIKILDDVKENKYKIKDGVIQAMGSYTGIIKL